MAAMAFHIFPVILMISSPSSLQCGAPKRYKLVYKPHEYYGYKYHKPQLLELCAPTERYRQRGHHKL